MHNMTFAPNDDNSKAFEASYFRTHAIGTPSAERCYDNNTSFT